MITAHDVQDTASVAQAPWHEETSACVSLRSLHQTSANRHSPRIYHGYDSAICDSVKQTHPVTRFWPLASLETWGIENGMEFVLGMLIDTFNALMLRKFVKGSCETVRGT